MNDMKKVLVTGLDGYIGTSISQYIESKNIPIKLSFISVKGNEWKTKDFSEYDSILHLAGIAHVSSDKSQEKLYRSVNTDLTLSIAEKAKSDGVEQFVFMSSIIVFGDKLGNRNMIDIKTIPKPNNFYGESKLNAEKGLIQMEDQLFKCSIIRPPMIYGKGSKGNYVKLSKLAQKTCLFPEFENARSMLYISNLCELVVQIILQQKQGVFHPQNKEYVNTSNLVKAISRVHGKRIYFTRVFNPLIKLLGNVEILRKVFGNLTYSMDLSNEISVVYQVTDFIESIELTESIL